MWRARPRERAAAEEDSTEIGAPTAGLGHDLARRPVERHVVAIEHPGLCEHVQRVRLVADVQLIPRLPVEGVTAVGADLGLDAQLAQERERTSDDGVRGDVEVEGERAATA
jgi:hypothetical protein